MFETYTKNKIDSLIERCSNEMKKTKGEISLESENIILRLEPTKSIYFVTPIRHSIINFDTSNLNILENEVYSFEMLITMNSNYSLIFPSNVTWVYMPTFSTNEKYLLEFTTYDKGINWVAFQKIKYSILNPNFSQWGSQWDDPIIWENIPNYITSANGRKFARHPSNMGTVMSMNDGADRNILILDAQYRGRGIWGIGYTKELYSGNLGFIDNSMKSLPFEGWTDEELNESYSAKANQDFKTSKENTDSMFIADSNISHFAGFCRNKKISHNGIEIGCDAPNINVISRIFSEMIKLDEMDPTTSFYPGYNLTNWFTDSDDSCWTSSLSDETHGLYVENRSYIFNGSFASNFAFIPILEL